MNTDSEKGRVNRATHGELRERIKDHKLGLLALCEAGEHKWRVGQVWEFRRDGNQMDR